MYSTKAHPQHRGFDYFLGFLAGGADFYTHEKCYADMCGYDFREAFGGQDQVSPNCSAVSPDKTFAWAFKDTCQGRSNKMGLKRNLH